MEGAACLPNIKLYSVLNLKKNVLLNNLTLLIKLC